VWSAVEIVIAPLIASREVFYSATGQIGIVLTAQKVKANQDNPKRSGAFLHPRPSESTLLRRSAHATRSEPRAGSAEFLGIRNLDV
jgi:hypothetical protein